MRIHTGRTDEFSIGDILMDESTRKRYIVSEICPTFIDAKEIEKQPKRKPNQKYYRQFAKGWNR